MLKDLPKDRKEAVDTLERIVSERGKYYYGFFEYQWTRLLHYCCCCCLNKKSETYEKRDFMLNRYYQAQQRLTEEMDILKHVEGQRMTSFYSRLWLTDYQRALIPYNKRYQLDDTLKKEELKRRQSKFIRDMQRTSIVNLIDDESDWKRNNYDILGDKELTEAQKQLLLKVRDKFNSGNNTTDNLLLLEVTSYLDDSFEDDFLRAYDDFVHCRQQDALVRRGRIRKNDRRGLEVQESKPKRAESVASRVADRFVRGGKRVTRFFSSFKMSFKKKPEEATNNLGIQEEKSGSDSDSNSDN